MSPLSARGHRVSLRHAVVSILAVLVFLALETVPSGAVTADSHRMVVANFESNSNARLAWNDCGSHGTSNWRFACDTNTGPGFTMFGSLVLGSKADSMIGMEARIKVIPAEGQYLPNWWYIGDSPCRPYSALQPAFNFQSMGRDACADPYGGQGYGLYTYAFWTPPSGNYGLIDIKGDSQGSPYLAIEPDVEYYMFGLTLTRANTTNCYGCSIPMTLELQDITLMNSWDPANPRNATIPGDHDVILWQGPANTSVQTALVRSEVTSERVHLEWMSYESTFARLERREDDGPWREVGTITADRTHLLTYDDIEVRPGASYGYRLALPGSGPDEYVGQASVVVPARSPLAIVSTRWERDGAVLNARIALPRRGDTTLELYDVSGRRQARRVVSGAAAGEQEVRLDLSPRPPAGMYYARVTQAGESRTRGVTLTR